jgi:hypothetical protein
VIRSLGIGLVAIALLATAPAQAYIASPYFVNDGHTYVYLAAQSGDSLDWAAARSAAQALGAGWDLASITSVGEQAFINSKLPTVNTRSQVWVGGIQATSAPYPAAGWSWVTGESLSGFQNWGQGADWQPDDWGNGGKGTGQQIYIALDSTFYNGSWGFSNWAWDDNNTYTQFTIGAVAEVARVVPIPSAVWLLGAGVVGLVTMKRRKRG